MDSHGTKTTSSRAVPKGPVKCRHELTIRSRSHEALGPQVEAWIFREADVLCEGSVRDDGNGEATWFGSTMVTVDLSVISARWRGPFDEAARARFLQLLEGSVRIRLRALRLACAEVGRRLPDRRLGTASVETRFRVVGEKLHLDVDLEVPIGVSCRRRQR